MKWVSLYSALMPGRCEPLVFTPLGDGRCEP